MKPNNLPKLRKINFSKKKHIYKINDTKRNRRKAIDENIKKQKTKKKIKAAALSKKSRFNMLRIYRRYKYPKQCKILTDDMKYIDKKYNLNNTKNICN